MSDSATSSRPDTLGTVGKLSDLVAPDERPARSGISRAGWIQILIVGALICTFYRDQLVMLKGQFLSNADWSHGWIIPLFSLYLLYAWRKELRDAPRRSCFWGLVLVVVSIMIYAFGVVIAKNHWICQLSMPVMIFGATLYLAGPRVAFLAMVPIFYLWLGMPWPEKLYREIATPMQELAAGMSASILRLCGVQVIQSSSSLRITSVTGVEYPLQVAEACSGVRSLMAFVALGVAMAYIEPRALWQRIVIIGAGVPIALFVNILRVTATCTAFVLDKEEFGREFMHTAMGMVLLIPALLLLMLLCKTLSAVYEDDEEDDEDEEGDDDNDSDSDKTDETKPSGVGILTGEVPS